MQSIYPFSILAHLDKLTPDGGKENKYERSFHCPVCGAKNFKVNLRTGEYGTYSCSCATTEVGKKQIRDAIAPLERQNDYRQNYSLRPRLIQPTRKAITLARYVRPLEETCGYKPKYDRSGAIETKFWYYTNQRRVSRRETPQGKIVRPETLKGGRWSTGKDGQHWGLYNIDDAIAFGKDSYILMVEGEPCTDAASKMGLVAITTQGGEWTDEALARSLTALQGKVAGIVYWPDRDEAGDKKRDTVARVCQQMELDFLAIDPLQFWPECPEKGDIADWHEARLAELKKDDILEWYSVLQADIERLEAIAREEASKPALELVQPPQPETLQNAIARALSESGDRAEYEIAKAAICRDFKVSPQQFDRICDRMEEPDLEQIQKEVEAQIWATGERLDLDRVLPPELAVPLTKLAGWMHLRPESFLTAMLAASGSLFKNGTFLNLCPETSFLITPNLYVALVAESSQRKSPLLKSMVSRPLNFLNTQAKDEHSAALRRWESEYGEKENDPDTPKKPERKLHYFTKTTGEAILRQVSRVADTGMTWISDELPALIKGQNQYRSGRGSDKEDLLSYYDGTGGQVLRASGLQDDVETFNLSIVGGIQPRILQELLGDCEDPGGEWARFFFVNQPLVAGKLPETGASLDINGLLIWLYQQIHDLQPQTYYLSGEARRYFKAVYDRCEQIRVDEEPRMAMRSVWGKVPGRIGKIALILHAIEAICRGQLPATAIEVETIKRAVKLAHFSVRQIESLYLQFQDCGRNPSAQMMAVLELAEKRQGTLSPSDVSRFGDRGLRRLKAPDVKEIFRQLEEMGYGSVVSKGNSTKFSLALNDDSTFAHFRTLSHGLSHSQRLTPQVTQPLSHTFARPNENGEDALHSVTIEKPKEETLQLLPQEEMAENAASTDERKCDRQTVTEDEVSAKPLSADNTQNGVANILGGEFAVGDRVRWKVDDDVYMGEITKVGDRMAVDFEGLGLCDICPPNELEKIGAPLAEEGDGQLPAVGDRVYVHKFGKWELVQVEKVLAASFTAWAVEKTNPAGKHPLWRQLKEWRSQRPDPIYIKQEAGFCDRRGNPQGWTIQGSDRYHYHCKLAGMSERKKIGKREVKPEHLVYPDWVN